MAKYIKTTTFWRTKRQYLNAGILTPPVTDQIPWMRRGAAFAFQGVDFGPPAKFPYPVITSPQKAAQAFRRPFLVRDPDQPSVQTRVTIEKWAHIFNSLSRQGYIQQISKADYAIIGGAFQAARAPGVADDVSIGAVPGSPWVNTANGKIYFCISNASLAATWVGPIG